MNKQIRSLLPSLIIQLPARSNPFCNMVYRLYKAYDNGADQTTDNALTQCLQDMLTLPGQGPIYLIVGAEERPNTFGFPYTRKQVVDLVKHLVGL